LADAAELREFGEDQADRLLDPAVRVQLDRAVGSPTQPGRQRKRELAPLGLGHDRLVRSWPEQAQLVFPRRAIDAENQTIPGADEIIDLIEISDPSIEVPTQFEQLRPALELRESRDASKHRMIPTCPTTDRTPRLPTRRWAAAEFGQIALGLRAARPGVSASHMGDCLGNTDISALP